MVPPMPVMAVYGRFVARIGDWLNPEGAAYAANNAANHAADEAAKRSCRMHAHVSTMNNTIGDALCLRRKR
jgi:hypothetical protein